MKKEEDSGDFVKENIEKSSFVAEMIRKYSDGGYVTDDNESTESEEIELQIHEVSDHLIERRARKSTKYFVKDQNNC
jgi:hypothetical protein